MRCAVVGGAYSLVASGRVQRGEEGGGTMR